MSLLCLFFLFFYIGLCTIGGGLVAIGLMRQELLPRGLIPPEKFYSMIAISESTPGPIGVNMATYIGYELYGVCGGIILTFGIVLPSLFTIILIARFSNSFHEKPLIKKSFYGLRAGAVGMIAVAACQVLGIALLNIDLFKTTLSVFDLFNIKHIAFFCVLGAANLLTSKLHPVFFIAAGAAGGIFFL